MSSFSVNEQYFEYKACTQRFVQWIIDAAVGVDKSSKRLSNTLNALVLRTKLITTNSEGTKIGNFVDDELMQGFEESMNAGFRAIQLRKFVHQINIDPLSISGVKVKIDENQEQHRMRNESHAHCIRVLQQCYSSLRKWWKGLCAERVQTAKPTTNAKAESAASFNMFSVLQSLEDLNVTVELGEDGEDSESVVESEGATIEQIDATVTNADGSVMTDLRITALCFLYDLATAMKEVKAAWQQVREEKISILTAVTVTMTAYREIRQRCSAFELKYPSMESAEDFYECALVRALNLSEKDIERLAASQATTGTPSSSDHTLDECLAPLRGQEEFLIEQIEIIGMLTSLSRSFPRMFQERKQMIYRRGHLGVPFHEEAAPLKRFVPKEIIRFLAVEMSTLFNNYLMVVDAPSDKRDVDLEESDEDDEDDDSDEDVESSNGKASAQKAKATSGSHKPKKAPSRIRFLNQPLTHEFYETFIPHFERGVVSMAEVFLVHCWIQSVYVLQDPQTHFLGRSLYRLRKFGREIDETVKDYLADPTLDVFYDDNKNRRDVDKVLIGLSYFVSEQPYGAVRAYGPLHVNPVLQGCVILDKLTNYLHLSTQCMQGLSSYHRAICHLVHALQQEGFLSAQQLQEMPMLADFYNFYKRFVFVGAKDSGIIDASKGQYERQYLLASHVTAYGLSKHVQGAGADQKAKSKLEKRRHEVKKRQRLDPDIVSPVYKCLVHKDYSGIFADYSARNKNGYIAFSLRKLLQRVKDLTEKEIYETKYFTFKLTNYHLQGYRLFAGLRRDAPTMFESVYQMNYDSEMLRNETRSFRHTQALELTIVQPILSFLDTRNPSVRTHVSDGFTVACRGLATVLGRYFMSPVLHPLATPSAPPQPFLKPPYTNRQAKLSLIDQVTNKLEEDHMTFLQTEVNANACGHVKAPYDGFYRFSQDVIKPVWLKDEFGHFTSSQLHKAGDVAISNMEGDPCFLHTMDQLEDLEESMERILKKAPEKLSKAEKEKLQDARSQMKLLIQRLGRENPVIFTQVDVGASNLKITLLDHAICGIWRGQADVDLVEWILQMWGLNFNTQMGHSPLQVAIIGRESWAVELLLRQDTAERINFQSPRDGNTALHYAALAGDESVMYTLTNNYCNSNLRNHRGQLATEVIPMSLRDFQRSFERRTDSLGRQEEATLLDLANNGAEKRSAMFADAAKKRQSQKMKQLREEEKQYVPTAEDIAKTERAQKELLEMLEREEAEEAARKSKKGANNNGAKKSGGKKK